VSETEVILEEMDVVRVASVERSLLLPFWQLKKRDKRKIVNQTFGRGRFDLIEFKYFDV